MKPSFDNLKGRRVYQFVLDEKTGKIEDISDSMDYVKIVRCKDCKHKHIKDNVWTCPFGLPAGCDFYCGYGERETE